METQKKRYTVKLNSNEKIEALLQETYDLACKQYTAIQNEMNKIANSTVINSLDIDGKEKYAKIMNNYLTLQQKATAQKFDIAKLMAEIVKHNGNVKDAIDDAKKTPTTLDLNKLRELAVAANTTNTEEYVTKK